MRVLHKFDHGLGDCTMFSAVLRHLKEYKPDWTNDVLCPDAGKHLCFVGAADVYQTPPAKKYDQVIHHDWPECIESWHDSPGTKAAKCLRSIFGIKPDPELLGYDVHVTEDAEKLAGEYVAKLPNKPFALVHYQGNTSTGQKNLSHDVVGQLAKWLIVNGMTPVILDWDNRSPLPNNTTIFKASIPTNAGVIAALIRKAKLFVGIDSGPCKVAYSTTTPTVTVWTGYHPYHYADHTPNAVHLVPHEHQHSLRGNRSFATQYFLSNYRHTVYDPNHLFPALSAAIVSLLKIEELPMAEYLKSTAFDADYYEEHRIGGLDYLEYGDWQRNYAKWIVEALDLKGKTVLDVGCACGSIANGFAEQGTLVSGIDPNEHMISLGRQKWLKGTLKICDAVNLHYWGDKTFDFIHSAQVFEHFKPEHVPLILKEIHRVTKDGGRMFFALDTTEMYERQGRKIEDEDPTHYCVKPQAWWKKLLAKTGWEIDEESGKKLTDHPGSYFSKYDWDWFCVRKVTPVVPAPGPR
jgi:SAM-dependent methyltransferase